MISATGDSDDFDWAEIEAIAAQFELLARTVGHDCLRDVSRARVVMVQTRTPNPHYL